MLTIDLFQEKPDHEGYEYGFCVRVAGQYNNTPYCVDVWCEYDGRDVEYEPVWGIGKDDPDFFCDFFEALCVAPGFEEAIAIGYKRWEAAL